MSRSDCKRQVLPQVFRPALWQLNRRHLLASFILALPVGASAGAWESGSFDNDDAMDWVAMCVRSKGASAVGKTLEASLKPAYLEAPEASEAIAAAEVVAAARGKPNSKLPSTLATWLQGQSRRKSPAWRPPLLAPWIESSTQRVPSCRNSGRNPRAMGCGKAICAIF